MSKYPVNNKQSNENSDSAEPEMMQWSDDQMSEANFQSMGPLSTIVGPAGAPLQSRWATHLGPSGPMLSISRFVHMML